MNLDVLARTAVELTRLGVAPQAIAVDDFDQLPNLGGGFNDGHTFRHLSALLETSDRALGESPIDVSEETTHG